MRPRFSNRANCYKASCNRGDKMGRIITSDFLDDEFSSVFQLYKKNPAQNCVADVNGDVYEEQEFLDKYEWAIVSELDGALRQVGPFLVTMEASEKVTCYLVIPMALAIIHATSKEVPMLCYSYEYGELSEDFVDNDELCEEMRLVRNKLHL